MQTRTIRALLALLVASTFAAPATNEVGVPEAFIMIQARHEANDRPEKRQSTNSYTTDPTTLLIGYCAAIGTCHYGQVPGCYTPGCLQPNLGGICSCVEQIQDIIIAETTVGRSYWPVVAA